jgi:hypothetical protein
MQNQQNSWLEAESHDCVAHLSIDNLWLEVNGKRVKEDGSRFSELNTMLREILLGLGVVPGKTQAREL